MTEQEAKKIIQESRNYAYTHFGFTDSDGQALDMAISALEKQIPIKPVVDHVRKYTGDNVYKCPVCGGALGVRSFALNQKEIGCSRCLQAIDWTEGDTE